MKINVVWATLLTTLMLASVFLVSTLVTAIVPLFVHLESKQNNSATSNLGTIVFAGTSYSLPRDITKPGTMPYPVQYNPASGYEFVRWETSGGVSVADPYENPTMATVVWNGTLRAIYKTRPPPTHDVNLQSRQDDGSTSNLGTIDFDGSTYHLPTAAVKPSGTYPTNYNPASGYKFVRWETSGGITVADSNSQSTSATVTGGGTLRAIYTPSPNVTVWISPMISTGQTFKVDIMVFASSLGQTPIGAPSCIYAWTAEVHFDPTVMAARSLDEGTFLLPGGPVLWVEKSINNTNGVIKLNQTLLGDVPGVNGTGVLATVTFGVIKPENSSISLKNVGYCSGLGIALDVPETLDGYFTPTHDIAVKSVTVGGLTSTPKNRIPGASEVYPGWPIEVIISNLGNYNETAVNVTLFIIDEYGAPAHYKSETLEAIIPPEMDDSLEFVIPFEPDLGALKLYVNYTLGAYATPVPGETDTLDNVYIYGLIMIKMTGDVNCDRRIDIKDIVAIAVAYGSITGDPRYDVKADVNCDGKIDIKDIVLVATRYRQTVQEISPL